jgi:lysophospholipase L1-like esterase
MKNKRSVREIILLFAFTACFGSLFAQDILVIGDSNAAMEGNWVTMLQGELPGTKIINCAVSGNTIGFDNNGRQDLNTLRNVKRYLDIFRDSTVASRDKLVIIALGTNDCKKVFDGMQETVLRNMNALLDSVNYYLPAGKILLISPLATGKDEQLEEKYEGISVRVASLIGLFREIALRNNAGWLDVYNPLKDQFQFITTDGIHLNKEGQGIVCGMIEEYIRMNYPGIVKP